jgi:hypothetical protein
VIAVDVNPPAPAEMLVHASIAARGRGGAANVFVVPGVKRFDHGSRLRDRTDVQQNAPILRAQVERAENRRAPLIYSDLEKVSVHSGSRLRLQEKIPREHGVVEEEARNIRE